MTQIDDKIDLGELVVEEKTKEEVIEIVWAKYDVDKSGVLEKGEAMKFLRDTFKEVFGTE